MKPGYNRFEYYLEQLEGLLNKAKETDNPASYLYKNDGRTICFMLEGLSRLYAGMHNEKKFDKIKDYFKQVEDLLGAMDYYDDFAKDFGANVKAPVTIKIYLTEKMEENTAKLNDVLKEEKWLKEKKGRIEKIRKKLKKADWLKEKSDVESIQKFYEKEISEILMFVKETDNGFTELESQVHELRRKLRWLSIYPKALQGCIQLTDSHMSDPNIRAYLTKDIVDSPFNVMPDNVNCEYELVFERNYFLALSFVIASLGTLKDEGLQLFVLTEAVQFTEQVSSEDAHQISSNLLELKPTFLEDLLSTASVLVKTYFDRNYLKNLVVGVHKL